MFRMILPREVCFFGYFEQHAAVIIEACDAFQTLAVNGIPPVPAQASEMKALEHKADKVTHQCIEELTKTFITPLDRADIQHLIKRMDDIVDSIDGATSRIVLYGLVEMRHEVGQLARVLVESAREIEAALKGLRKLKDVALIKEKLISIHRLENEGDIILREALARLFQETDPILVIKWKEIFERLENATDQCEEVANIIEKIVLEAS